MEVMGKYLWLAVEADKYELPLAVADTAEELGKMFGIKKNTVINCVARNRSGRENGYRYIKVLNDGEEDGDTEAVAMQTVQEVR